MENTKATLSGKKALVLGGSRGFGRGVALALADAGADTTSVSRHALTPENPDSRLRSRVGDASDPSFCAQILDELTPEVIVLTVGATPVMRRIADLDWESFSCHWQSEVKATFHLLRECLQRAKPGTRVVVFSSGAALGGSPLSGGYASAKQAQRYLCKYARGEAEKRELDLNVQCVLPDLSPATTLGGMAARAYAIAAGISFEEFANKRGESLTPDIVGHQVVQLLSSAALASGPEWKLSASGLTALE
ncbi:MAG: SDR family oxidoreductase [Polyangiaceae bacterium]